MNELLNAVDCALIRNPSNLFYFSRYKNEDATILFCGEKNYYLTDLRYLDEAMEYLSDFEIVDTKRDIYKTIEAILKNHNCKTLGIEYDMPLNFYNDLIKNIDFIKTKDISPAINKLRSIKTSEEIEMINAAQQITDKAFSQLLNHIKEGITERHLQYILEDLIYKNGGEGMSFDTIVAFGSHAARPHHQITDKKLQNNQLIKLDFGAKYKGLLSDMTRTIAFGEVPEEQKQIYELVLEAQNLAIENAKVGMQAKKLYHIVNDFFISKGVEKYFLHSLGHGVGTDVHELPFLSPKSQDTMKENMVVTIEPGLYFAKKFGVRIEDMIVFKKEGVINLTKSPKQLIII